MDINFLGFRGSLFKEFLEKLGHTVTLVDNHDNLAPCDVVLTSGYYQMIPSRVFTIPRKGFYLFHETDLPEGRGHAPLSWTLIYNRPELIVTMFSIAKAMDAGDIVGKEYYRIKKYDTLLDLRERAVELCKLLMQKNLPAIEKGDHVLTPQSGTPTYYRRRTPDDGQIDPSKSILEQWNLIRACHPEDYPAYFYIDEVRFFLRVERDPDWNKEMKNKK